MAAGTSGESRSGASSSTDGQTLQVRDYAEIKISSLGLNGDREARQIIRRSLRDAWPAARRFGWRVEKVCELDPSEDVVGYTGKDGTISVKVRDPGKGGYLYPYSFVLATLLHELTHLSVLGHGKGFYRRLAEAASECGAEPAVRREVRSHVCGELLNAVCDNDAKRAKALLTVMPEAVRCRPPGPGRQGPLEYAAHHGRVALTKLLLQARADPDSACGADKVPPLARAAAQGNKKTMRVLLDAGASRGRADLPTDLGGETSVLMHDGCDCKVAGKGQVPMASRRSVSLPALPSAKGQGSGLSKPRRRVVLGGGGSLSL